MWDMLNEKVRTSETQISNLGQYRKAVFIAWDQISHAEKTMGSNYVGGGGKIRF